MNILKQKQVDNFIQYSRKRLENTLIASFTLQEFVKLLDIPDNEKGLLRQQWNKLDYIYYADELSKIHNQGIVYIEDLESMRIYFPKYYYILKASGAKAATFFTLEGYNSAIGLVVILYAMPTKPQYNRNIFQK